MKKLLCVMLVCISTTLPAYAEDNTAFTKLVEKLRQHPEIQAYVQKAESARHYAKGELGLPDPMLFIQEQDYPIGTSMSRDQEEKMIGFRQVIPAFGSRGAKSKRIDVESRKNKLLADYAFAAMKAKMITALANLERIKKQEKLLDEQVALFSSERASLKGRIAANQIGVSQLSMNQVDSTDIEIMRAELMEEKHEMMAMLTNMLGETPEVSLPQIRVAAWDRDIGKTYPVMVAKADIDIARQDVNLRRSEFNPSFEVQTSYGRMNGGDKAGSIMVGLSVPLWAAQSQRPKLDGAKSAMHAAEVDQDTIKRQTIEMLDHLQAQIDTSTKKLELLKRKASLLRVSSSAQTREYEAGKADFSIPLKTRRDMISVEYQLAEERAKHTALVADFNRYIIQGD
jgi:outer membrane protein, heavy metal efflux system